MLTITCKLPESLAAQLEILAREQRCSKSAVLRDALEFRLAEQRDARPTQALDLVKHLCGALEGGPHDLATNPEHLSGFGR